MPWSVDAIGQGACAPKGSEDDLAAALTALGLGGEDRSVIKRNAAEEIRVLATAFNGQLALVDRAPTTKDIRERLQAVVKAMDGAIEAFERLDDASIDWLFGRVDVFGLSLAGKVHAGAGQVAAAFGHSVGGSADESGSGWKRRDALEPVLDRLTQIKTIAECAIEAHKEYFGGAGGPLTAVDRIVGTPKTTLALGCWRLAGEYLAPERLTTSVASEAPFAALVRAVFAYATAKNADDPGQSFDREIKAVAQDRIANRSEGEDRLNEMLRRERMKPT